MLVVASLIHLLHLVHPYYSKAAQATLVQSGLSKRQVSSWNPYPYWLVRRSFVWDWQDLWLNGTGTPFSITCMGPDNKKDILTRLVLIHKLHRFKNRTLVIADIGEDASGRPCKCPPISNSTVATGSCGHARTPVPSFIPRGANVTGNICGLPRNFTYSVPVSTCDDNGRYVCQGTGPYENKIFVVDAYVDIRLDKSKIPTMRMSVPETPPTVSKKFTLDCVVWFAMSEGIYDQVWKWEYVDSRGVVDVGSFDTRTHSVSVFNSLRVPGLCYLQQMSRLVIDPVTVSLEGKTIRCVFESYRYDPVRFPCFEGSDGYYCGKSYNFKKLEYPDGQWWISSMFPSTGERESVGVNAGVVAGATVGALALLAAVVGGILYSRGKLPMVCRKVKAKEPHESPEDVELTSHPEPRNEANAGQPETDQAVPSQALQVKVNAYEDRHADADTGNEETL